MRILCVNQALDVRAGSESYLETVIDELVTLGHEVAAWSPLLGATASRLMGLGCHVYRDLTEVGEVDVIHAQHATATLAARAQFPNAPIVYACHSWAIDIEDPPAAAEPAVLLAFNDVVEERLRASRLGERTPVRRLRQPVSMTWLEGSRFPIAQRHLIGVAINQARSGRLDVLDAACRAVGIFLKTPTREGPLPDPVPAMMSADVVFAVGRTALEAMALSRAAFIFDQTGSAGFVTADSYTKLEACGFTPAAGEALTLDDLVTALGQYEQDLGQLGRELVGRHHAARAHAAQLVDLYRSVIRTPTVVTTSGDALSELALLEQRLFEKDFHLRHNQWERARAERRALQLERDLNDRDLQLLHAEQERTRAEQERAHAEQDALRLQGELDLVRGSRSWRVTRPLRALRRRRTDPEQ